VCSFNKKLKKLVKNYKHASVIKIDPSRNLFSNHGLHLNTAGKERLAKQITACVNTILRVKEGTPIAVG
jgi:flagellar basal body-associated protein FliL